MKKFMICFLILILCSCQRNEIYFKQKLIMENDIYERITYPITPYKKLNTYITNLIDKITNTYHNDLENDTTYELQISFDYYEYETSLSFLATATFKNKYKEETTYHPFTYNHKTKQFQTLKNIGYDLNYPYYFCGNIVIINFIKVGNV